MVGLLMCGNWVCYWQEVAGLSVEPCEGETIIVTVFEIKKTEVLAFQCSELLVIAIFYVQLDPF